MQQSLFTVRLIDLERGKKHYDWVLPLSWLRQVFDGTDATVESPGALSFDASISSRRVILRGEACAKVTMPCARTLEPVPIDLAAEVYLVLSPAAASTETHHGSVGSSAKGHSHGAPATKTVEVDKRHASRRPEKELSEDEAAEDLYHGDSVDLDEFIREFLLLELPLKPLRSDLLFEERPAIPPTPEATNGGASSPAVDPRLQPLAQIASRLRKTTKE